MLSILRTSHKVGCDLDPEHCRCAIQVSLMAGHLGLVSAVAQLIIGYFTSLAVMTDAQHSFGDFSGYYLAAFVWYKWGTKPSHRAQINTSRIMALLLFISIWFIGYEAWHRASLAEYPIHPEIAIWATLLGIIANGITLVLFTRNKERNMITNSQIGHAKTDLFHSLTVFLLTLIVVILGDRLSLEWQRWLDLRVSFVLITYMVVVMIFMAMGKHTPHLKDIVSFVRRKLSSSPDEADTHHAGCDHH